MPRDVCFYDHSGKDCSAGFSCVVFSKADVITVPGHTHSFIVQSKSTSPFVSCKTIKTKQEVQITYKIDTFHPNKINCYTQARAQLQSR